MKSSTAPTLFDLRGRTALITGSTRGIGLADHVVAVEGKRQAQLLDAEGVCDALLGEGGHSLRAHSQFFKAWIVQNLLQVCSPQVSHEPSS